MVWAASVSYPEDMLVDSSKAQSLRVEILRGLL